MKKIICGILAIIMTFGLVACGEKEEKPTGIKIENNEQIIENNDNEFEKLTNEQKSEIENKANELLGKYMNIDATFNFETGRGLEDLGLTLNMNGEKYNENYLNTGIVYSDFKAAMLNYVSNEYFAQKYESGTQFMNVDGKLYAMFMASSGWNYESEKMNVKLVGINNGKYEFEVQVTELAPIVDKYECEMINEGDVLKVNSDIKLVNTNIGSSENFKYTDEEMLNILGIDLADTKTSNHMTISDDGAEVVVDSNKINVNGFMGKVKSFAYNLSGSQLYFWGNMIILNEEGEIFVGETSDTIEPTDSYVVNGYAVNKLETSKKIESISNVNFADEVDVIVKYVDGTYGKIYGNNLDEINLKDYTTKKLLSTEYKIAKVSGLYEEATVKDALSINEISEFRIGATSESNTFGIVVSYLDLNGNKENETTMEEDVEIDYENATISMPSTLKEDSILNKFNNFSYFIDSENNKVILRATIRGTAYVVEFENIK